MLVEAIRQLVGDRVITDDRYDKADLTSFALGHPSDLEHRLSALLTPYEEAKRELTSTQEDFTEDTEWT